MSWLNSQLPLDDIAELMRKAADGDVEAFECLYRAFAPPVRHFFARHGVARARCENLAQSVFARLWEKREDFRADSSFETYLFSIAKNTLSKEIKRSHRIETGLQNHAQRCGRPHNGLSHPEAEVCLKELAAAIEEAKGKLTERQRQALDAANDPDIRPGEASGQSGCSNQAHRSRLKRARKCLRGLLACFLNDENDSDTT